MRPYRLASFALSVAFAMAAPASATLLVYEGFDYISGNLTDKNGGTGFTGAWQASGSNTPLAVPSPAAPLNYPDLPTAGNSIVDNSNSSSTGVRANLRTWDSTSYTDNGDVLWFSALFQKGGATTGEMQFGFVSGASPFTTPVGFQVNAGGTTVAALINSGTSASTLSFASGATSTHLVVGRLDFSDTPNADTVTIWLDPNLSVVPTSGGVSLSGTFPISSNVTLRGSGTYSGWADEIRIGTAYEDVIRASVPEPASLGIVGVCGALLLTRRRSRTGQSFSSHPRVSERPLRAIQT